MLATRISESRALHRAGSGSVAIESRSRRAGRLGGSGMGERPQLARPAARAACQLLRPQCELPTVTDRDCLACQCLARLAL